MRDDSIAEEGPTRQTRFFTASSTKNNLAASDVQFRNSYVFEGGDRWDKRLGEFKLRDDNTEGRASFIRRMTYEPDLKKRQQRIVQIRTDPAEFLDLYKQRMALNREIISETIDNPSQGGRMMMPPPITASSASTTSVRRTRIQRDIHRQENVSDYTNPHVSVPNNVRKGQVYNKDLKQ